MATVEQLTIEFKGKGAPALTKSINTLSTAMNRLAGIQDKTRKANNKYNEGFTKTHRNTEAINGAFGRFGRTMSGMRSKMLIVAFAFGVVAKAVQALHKAVSEFQIAQAKLEAIITSTGGAAGKTSKQLEEMANKLQETAGISNTAAMEMQARLLTFTSIVGDNFEKATEAILDMSTVLGTDLNQATIQIAKALNDPLLGLTALRKSGIGFTEQQKEQIRTLMENGSILKAQAIIFKELNTQMGGVNARARQYAKSTTLLTDLTNKWGDALRELGEILDPYIQDLLKLVNFYFDVMLAIRGAQEASQDWMNTFKETGKIFQSSYNEQVKFNGQLGQGAELILSYTQGLEAYDDIVIKAAQDNVDFFKKDQITEWGKALSNATDSKEREDLINKLSAAIMQNNLILETSSARLIKAKKIADDHTASLEKKKNAMVLQMEMNEKGFLVLGKLTELEKLQLKFKKDEITPAMIEEAEAIDAITEKIAEQNTERQNALDIEKEQEETRALMVEARQQALDLLNENQDRRIEKARETADAEISEIHRVRDEELDSLRASWKYQKATDAQKKQLEKEITDRHKKSEAEARKVANKQMAEAFKVKQTMDIANTIMSTQVAVMNTLAAGAGFFSSPQAMIVAAMGAMSVATIASQKPPTMQYGGLVGGNRHSQGGTMIEAEQGEFVVSRSGVDATGLEALNRINSGGGGAGGTSIIINNPIIGKDTIEDEIVPQIKEALRRGGDIGV